MQVCCGGTWSREESEFERRAGGGEIELKAGWISQEEERGGLGGWAKEEGGGG